MKEEDIRRHWQDNPVGERLAGHLENFSGDYEAFFSSYDAWYYGSQGHVLRALDSFSWSDKAVLEIGLGQGSDSEQLIRRGARWSGIDLTEEATTRVTKRLSLRGLAFGGIVQGSATALPFRDAEFDIVFSHGVLHHVPDILSAQREISRVLRPGGRLVVMVYARNSLNYQLSIKWLRRIGLALIYALPMKFGGVYAEHKRNAKSAGLWNYLAMSNFIHRSTDGPRNPYAKVYDRATLANDFPDFEIVRTFKKYMHAPPLPMHGLPGESLLGWHLWAELRRR
jgi:ubiquinone/menaquinone biosynthesis C-methylase UbiE